MPESNKSKAPPRTANLEEVVVEKQPLLHPQESIQQAGDKMRALDAGALPVSEGRRLVGLVDQRDPDRRAAGFGHDPKTMLIREYMNTNVVCCHEDDDCAEALRKMDERQLDRLPVVDRDMRILGVVTRADLTERGPNERPSAAGE